MNYFDKNQRFLDFIGMINRCFIALSNLIYAYPEEEISTVSSLSLCDIVGPFHYLCSEALDIVDYGKENKISTQDLLSLYQILCHLYDYFLPTLFFFIDESKFKNEEKLLKTYRQILINLEDGNKINYVFYEKNREFINEFLKEIFPYDFLLSRHLNFLFHLDQIKEKLEFHHQSIAENSLSFDLVVRYLIDDFSNSFIAFLCTLPLLNPPLFQKKEEQSLKFFYDNKEGTQDHYLSYVTIILETMRKYYPTMYCDYIYCYPKEIKEFLPSLKQSKRLL